MKDGKGILLILAEDSSERTKEEDKTRHWYFRYGFPLIAIAQLALAAWLFSKSQVLH